MIVICLGTIFISSSWNKCYHIKTFLLWRYLHVSKYLLRYNVLNQFIFKLAFTKLQFYWIICKDSASWGIVFNMKSPSRQVLLSNVGCLMSGFLVIPQFMYLFVQYALINSLHFCLWVTLWKAEQPMKPTNTPMWHWSTQGHINQIGYWFWKSLQV